jgi:AcrR family transcriptional regulator
VAIGHLHAIGAETEQCLGLVERGKHGKQLRQQALMEAATAVFAEHGYDAATTREVAERAGCSEGLIHRYFGGKRGLLIAILERKAAEFTERMRAELPDGESLAEEIDQVFLWPLESMWQQRDFMRVCVSRSATDPEVGHVVGDHLNRARVEAIAAKLRRHRAAGRVREDVDLDAIALGITGVNLTTGFFSQVVFGMDRDDVRRMTLEMAKLVTRGIATDREDERTGVARDGMDEGR